VAVSLIGGGNRSTRRNVVERLFI